MLTQHLQAPAALSGTSLQSGDLPPEQGVSIATKAQERYLISTYEERLRQQAACACYPDLLRGPLAKGTAPIYTCERAASGLIARVVRHDSLLPDQQRQLAEFRFRQYVLWHWFDTCAVISQHIQTDAAFTALPPTTLHGYVGTHDGHILAYFVFQPAVDHRDANHGLRGLVRGVLSHTYRLGDTDRPLFPAEWESFGPAVFGSVPALQHTPLGHIWELNTLMRDQARPDILTSVAAIEAIFTICQILIMPALSIRAAVGCINQDARGLLAKLGIPILYAPEAPVLHNRLPSYWAENMNDFGKFWPFVVSVPDFLAHLDYMTHFNDMLDGTPLSIVQQVGRFRQEGHYVIPTASRPTRSTLPYCWSDAPFQPANSTANGTYPVASAHTDVRTAPHIARPNRSQESLGVAITAHRPE